MEYHGDVQLRFLIEGPLHGFLHPRGIYLFDPVTNHVRKGTFDGENITMDMIGDRSSNCWGYHRTFFRINAGVANLPIFHCQVYWVIQIQRYHGDPGGIMAWLRPWVASEASGILPPR